MLLGACVCYHWTVCEARTPSRSSGERRVHREKMFRGVRAVVCAAVFMVSALGCRPEATPVRVSVCGDVAVPMQIDAVRVSILDAERAEVASGVRELIECPADRLRSLPQEFEFTQRPGEIRIVAQALLDGVEVGRSERLVLDASEGAELTVALEAACVGVTCPLGQTCVAGGCELVADATGLGCGGTSAGGSDAGQESDAGVEPVLQDMGTEEGADAGPGSLYCDP